VDAVRNYRQLDVYEKARRLTRIVYEATATMPGEERYGLTAQMRRSAVSISSNIAEGAGRGSPRELSRFLTIASGSASELQCQIELAQDLGFITQESAQVLTTEAHRVRKMLWSLDQKIRSDWRAEPPAARRQPPA
jgi:four helix bundle protein